MPPATDNSTGISSPAPQLLICLTTPISILPDNPSNSAPNASDKGTNKHTNTAKRDRHLSKSFLLDINNSPYRRLLEKFQSGLFILNIIYFPTLASRNAAESCPSANPTRRYPTQSEPLASAGWVISQRRSATGRFSDDL